MSRILTLLLVSLPVWAADTTISGYDANGLPQGVLVTNGQLTITQSECEDATNSLCRVEHYYSYATDDADLVVKSAAGFVHSIQCWPEDGTAEAGSVALRDATSAGAGTIVWGDSFAAAEHTPSGGVLDYAMATGIVIDFTTTTDVFCTVSYR